MKNKVNDRIKELRSALNLTQTEFAYQTGISHSLLTKIEAGDNPPTSKVVAKIVDKWNVDEEWLADGVGEMSFDKQTKSNDPWKDEAWRIVNDQLVKKDLVIDRLTQALLGGMNKTGFRKALNQTGQPKRRRLSEAA